MIPEKEGWGGDMDGVVGGGGGLKGTTGPNLQGKETSGRQAYHGI